MHAVADRRQLARINVALVAFAAAQVALSVLLVRLGGALGAPLLPALPPCFWRQSVVKSSQGPVQSYKPEARA